MSELSFHPTCEVHGNWNIEVEIRSHSGLFEVILQANYFQKMETKFYKVFVLAETCFKMTVIEMKFSVKH